METSPRAQGMATMPITGLIVQIVLILISFDVLAEFDLNFTPQIANPSQRQSVANIGCSNGLSTVNGHNRDGFSCGDGGYFMQEIVSDGLNEYYHLIIGDPDTDAFAQEYYILTGACCWFTAKGPANFPMFGAAPLSASWGDTGKLLSSALFPLAPVTLSGNGSGNPSRIHMRQINQDDQMYLEYNKEFNAKKQKITQIIDDGYMTSEFVLDNSNATYYESLAAQTYTNKLTLWQAPVGDFDVAADAPKQNVTGGRYIYRDGPGPDASFGLYDYIDTEFDPVYIDWLDYCNPEENSHRGCVGGPGPGGSGPGGPGADLRAWQADYWAEQ